jgi:hypothetical protein
MEIIDKNAYMLRVVEEFKQDAAAAANEFELKRKLWHASVVACEVDPTGYRDWHLTLAGIALEHGVKSTSAVTTVKSARRKAGVAL